MSFSVGLYRDFARKGGITFCTLPATQSSDYVSKRKAYSARMRRNTYHGSYAKRR